MATLSNVLFSPLTQLRAVRVRWQRPPSHSMLLRVYTFSRFWWILPLRHGNDGIQRAGNALLLLGLLVVVLTVTAGLYDIRHDVVAFGSEFVTLLGMYLIWVKHLLYRQRADKLRSLVLEFDALHHRNVAWAHAQQRGAATESTEEEVQAGHDVLELQRVFYIAESIVLYGYGALGALLVIALCLHPFITHEPLPIRCRFPFGLERHAYGRHVIYLLQCVYLAYEINALLLIDNLACGFCTQVAVNLRILCVRLRALSATAATTEFRNDVNESRAWRKLRSIVQRHQQLISLVERFNDCLYWGYVAQMGASTSIICLTAFEALLAHDQPLVAFKFQLYMFTASMHLFYWCLIGNIMDSDSLELANAAYDLRCWYDGRPALQLNLMFIIQRAQKPLLLEPSPLFVFNLTTFANILSTSYSYFTVLRTMIE